MVNPMTSKLEYTGKIFHVNMATKSFVLLKETEYDPQTHEGISRIVVNWNDDTRFTRVDTQNTFTGIPDDAKPWSSAAVKWTAVDDATGASQFPSS
jgi:hypothetical protein